MWLSAQHGGVLGPNTRPLPSGGSQFTGTEARKQATITWYHGPVGTEQTALLACVVVARGVFLENVMSKLGPYGRTGALTCAGEAAWARAPAAEPREGDTGRMESDGAAGTWGGGLWAKGPLVQVPVPSPSAAPPLRDLPGPLLAAAPGRCGAGAPGTRRAEGHGGAERAAH